MKREVKIKGWKTGLSESFLYEDSDGIRQYPPKRRKTNHG